jgi:Flp pilus assembly pilin Flp
MKDDELREKYRFLTGTAAPPRVTSGRLAIADAAPLSARERVALAAELAAAMIKDDSGAAAVEYALIATGLSLVGLVFAPTIGRTVADFFNAVATGFAP